MSTSLKTLIIGASVHHWRYSYMAAASLLDAGHEIVLIGSRPGEVLDETIQTGHPPLEGIHTVTLYINPSHQQEYADYILGLKPKRVIFNPGTENPILAARLHEAGVEVIPACTLVMLSADVY